MHAGCLTFGLVGRPSVCLSQVESLPKWLNVSSSEHVSRYANKGSGADDKNVCEITVGYMGAKYW